MGGWRQVLAIGEGRRWPYALLAAGVAAWLWPLGLGGMMPVGGDVTQFSIGLLGFLGQSLRAGRLPFWNDLWGYGFPGLAESQMGVYYPPHLLLYGLLTTEMAYTVSLVLHVLAGAIGAAWASRRFGAGAAGSALSGFVFATSGFAAIHVTHHWAFATGCWMPWAWGLGWVVVRGNGGRRAILALAAVLTLQILPGHFQLAFITQVGLIVLLICGGLARSGEGRRNLGRALGAMTAMGLVLPLAAMQLWPTWKLAGLAESDRTVAYLSEFAASPLHLVSYVAPGLFHRSPLWRPLAWDPFRTSPEEHLAYVGLVPLFLALGAIGAGWRRDPTIRTLSAVALITLLLSLGPYAPGFGLLGKLPGFAFFRAPARWGLATMLTLAILAGLGLDRLASWPGVGRRLVRFAVLAAVPPVVIVVGVELAFASTEGRGWPQAAEAFETMRRALPWPDDEGPNFREILAEARRPSTNPIVQSALARRGIDLASRLDRGRLAIYAEELGETAGLLVGLLALAAIARRQRVLGFGLVALTAVDLLVLGHHRDLELAPIRPLTEQSRVLARLAEGPRGMRTLDGLGNLPILAGAEPLRAYRTLDLPVVGPLTGLAASPIGAGADHASVLAAVRACGADFRVVESPGRTTARIEPGWSPPEVVEDEALASWNYGERWVASHPESRRFVLQRPEAEPARAWLVSGEPGSIAAFRDSSELVRGALATFARARPLAWRSPAPERFEVLDVEDPGGGPNLVLVTNLHYPEWRARWVGIGDGAQTREARVERVFASGGAGGWMAVAVPSKGRWSLILEYEGRAERTGLLVSIPAWMAWGIAFAWPRRGASGKSGSQGGAS